MAYTEKQKREYRARKARRQKWKDEEELSARWSACYASPPRNKQTYDDKNGMWSTPQKPRSLWDDIMDQFKPKRK